ncbi:hypothetical protein B9479_007954, partial [Cryptococcus floricola]
SGLVGPTSQAAISLIRKEHGVTNGLSMKPLGWFLFRIAWMFHTQ